MVIYFISITVYKYRNINMYIIYECAYVYMIIYLCSEQSSIAYICLTHRFCLITQRFVFAQIWDLLYVFIFIFTIVFPCPIC